MGLELELYFRGSDIKYLAAQDPGKIIVTATLVEEPSDSTPKNLILVAYATAYAANGQQVGNKVPACPSPCDPGGGNNLTPACQEAAEELLSSYLAKGLFSFL